MNKNGVNKDNLHKSGAGAKDGRKIRKPGGSGNYAAAAAAAASTSSREAPPRGREASSGAREASGGREGSSGSGAACVVRMRGLPYQVRPTHPVAARPAARPRPPRRR